VKEPVMNELLLCELARLRSDERGREAGHERGTAMTRAGRHLPASVRCRRGFGMLCRLVGQSGAA
jgi:hypothetical protein